MHRSTDPTPLEDIRAAWTPEELAASAARTQRAAARQGKPRWGLLLTGSSAAIGGVLLVMNHASCDEAGSALLLVGVLVLYQGIVPKD